MPVSQSQTRRQIKSFQISGVNRDLPPNELPDDIYSDCLNMEAFDIGMRSMRGHTLAFPSPLFAPEYLVFNDRPGLFFWIYASGAGIGVTDGELHFDITPAAGVTSVYPGVQWTHANLNSLVVLNNQVDVPVYWDNVTSNIMIPLPDWPAATVAGAIREFNYNLIAFNIDGPGGTLDNQMLWSNSADPGAIPDSWTPLPDNSAGSNTLSDTPGQLIDGQQFRDEMMIFKEHSTYTMRFIGGNQVFAFRKLFTTSGLLTTGCSAEYLGRVVILTDGDLILSDGQSGESLIDKRMRSWLFNQLDTDNYQNAFITAYQAENQVWVCFPENGETDCTLALVWDATDNKIGIRDLIPPTPSVARGQVGNVTGVISWSADPDNWSQDTTIWNQAIFNPTEDALLQADRIATETYAVNEGTSFNGTPINSKVEKSGMSFGDEFAVKLIRKVVPRIIGNVGTKVTIRVGAAGNDADIIAWTPPQDFIIGTQSQALDVLVNGRFIAFSVESETDQPSWQLIGMDFAFDWKGRF